MRFLAFVGTQGAMPAEAVAEMNRDWPAYAEELERHGGVRVGRELSLPETGVSTVRVRNGRTLVTDGPFLETKEYVAGIDVFEASSLEQAIALESGSPVARFLPFEVRAVPEAFRLGSRISAFGDGDDSEGIPYLLMFWSDASGAAPSDGAAVARACEAWQTEMEQAGTFVLGGPLGAPDTAVTLRMRDGAIALSDGPFLAIPEFICAVEVVRSGDRERAVALAAGHPLTQQHSVEVRSFYSASVGA